MRRKNHLKIIKRKLEKKILHYQKEIEYTYNKISEVNFLIQKEEVNGQ